MDENITTPLDMIDSINESIDGVSAIIDLLRLKDDRDDPLWDSSRRSAAHALHNMLKDVKEKANRLFELTKNGGGDHG